MNNVVSDLINQQVMNFKKYLEKEQKNLLLIKTGKNGEIVLPTIEELLKFNQGGGKREVGDKKANSKHSFMDTRVIHAYNEI